MFPETLLHITTDTVLQSLRTGRLQWHLDLDLIFLTPTTWSFSTRWIVFDNIPSVQ